ncbi:MAG TPA: glycoside hydrolase family 2 TIM barrel-domain containing protein [Thermoanaerobaculia bacterium]|nr:glycoside hydrolase family 2 TIM barrel-domain containing protein [Thermoanaerobaculia bacterium]
MLRLLLTFAVLALPLAAQTPRIQHTINEQWRFSPGPVERGEATDLDDSAWQRVNIPHTWNADDAFDKNARYRRGIGWYRKTVAVDPALRGKRIFLRFEGANQVADVYVNGRHAGRHIGGYTAFAFDVTALVTYDVPTLIAVRVDNSHDPDIPPLNADFTFFGGIYRDVWFVATSPVHVTVTDHASPGVFVSTPVATQQTGIARVRGTIRNDSSRATRLRVLNRIIDEAGVEVAAVGSNVSVAAGREATFDQQTRPIDGPQLWSPQNPYLYRLRTEVYDGVQLVDAVENPLGFRTFSVHPDRGLTLNGRPLKLYGTNRHQDYPGLGNALPDELHRRDVRLVKENGFNFLRLAHYPQDPAVLDEADRLGLVIWEEIPVVNLITTSAAFAENSERMLIEMIRQHYNHPSVFFWGYMNEVLLTKPDPVPDRYYEIVPELARRLENRARAEDPARLTVMALSRDEILDDKGIGNIPHVLGLNLYFGWYYETFSSLGPFLDRIHKERPGLPLIVSEYGADTDERVHTTQPRAFDFSSEHGQNFHVESFPQLEARPFVLGTAVWNQFDFASAGRQDTKFALNQKGLFFHNRTPKDTVFYYQAALLTKPVLYIAREWSERAGSRPEDRRQPVWVYTNQPEVELFVNGRSMGSRPAANRIVRWNVELVNGPNSVRAQAGSYEDRVTIVYADRTAGGFFAVNAGAHYGHLDEAHVYWEPDRAYVPGSWGYTGGKPSRTHHRIFGSNEDPLYQAAREGMEGYHFDVPDGVYEVTLGFAETSRDAAPGKRVFSVSVNGIPVIRDLDLAAAHGAYAATRRTTVAEARSEGGLRIEFRASAGEASIASIMVRRVH